jgi:hypothetical protein
LKRLALAAGLLCALPAASVWAQTAPPLVVTLDYSAPTRCPEANSFREQVLGRTKRVTFADARAPGSLVWSVKIAETSGGSRGTLRVTDEQPSTLERHVNAASCEQVVDALALVAALSVDPDASLTTRPQAEPAAPRAATPPAPPAPSPAPPAKRQASDKTSATKLSLGLTLTGRTGIAPRLTWAPRPSIGLSFRSRSGYTWGFSVSATQARGDATVDVGQADFTWTLARLEVFPVRTTYGNWRFEPAVFIEAGQLRARGVAVLPAAAVRRPALTAGALGRLSFLAFDLLWFDLEGGPLAPLVRDRFYLFDNTTVFRIPAVTSYVGAGVGLEFL